MKCRAAVLHKMGTPEPDTNSRSIKIEEIELDMPVEGEVLIKIAAVGPRKCLLERGDHVVAVVKILPN